MPMDTQISSGLHPLKQCKSIFPSSPSEMQRLGFLSSCAGHLSLHPLPYCRGGQFVLCATKDTISWNVILELNLL